MAITLRSVLESGGSSSIVCNMYDGMLSDASSYLTVQFDVPLEVGKYYIFSYKATEGSTPDTTEKYKYNEYVFKYTGEQTFAFGNANFKVTANSLQTVNYSGQWYYVWGRMYGGVQFPSDIDY